MAFWRRRRCYQATNGSVDSARRFAWAARDSNQAPLAQRYAKLEPGAIASALKRLPERVLQDFSRHRDARSLDRYSKPRAKRGAFVGASRAQLAEQVRNARRARAATFG